jgi:hypothetical protein
VTLIGILAVTPARLFRIVAAIVVAVFLLSLGLPSTAFVRSSDFSHWPFWTVVVRPESFILLWIAVVVPLMCILYGIRRYRVFEYAGWTLWVAFVAWVVFFDSP